MIGTLGFRHTLTLIQRLGSTSVVSSAVCFTPLHSNLCLALGDCSLDAYGNPFHEALCTVVKIVCRFS